MYGDALAKAALICGTVMVWATKGEAMEAQEARAAMDVLLEQERVLRYRDGFGSREAFELGSAAVALADEFDEGYCVVITREADGVSTFQWVSDESGERNLMFVRGKRAAAKAAGHASPWTQLMVAADGGDGQAVWDEVPEVVPSCGAFPVRVGDEWVATIGVSGLHEGLDHEVVVRALEKVLGVRVPRWVAPVA